LLERENCRERRSTVVCVVIMGKQTEARAASSSYTEDILRCTKNTRSIARSTDSILEGRQRGSYTPPCREPYHLRRMAPALNVLPLAVKANADLALASTLKTNLTSLYFSSTRLTFPGAYGGTMHPTAASIAISEM
jgi:hypothetical protein